MYYTIQEHTHRYAVWASARAANKNLLSKEISIIIEKLQPRNEVEKLKFQKNLTKLDYDNWLEKKGEEFIRIVKESSFYDSKKVRVSFGLAAKAISIYIKTVEVIPMNFVNIALYHKLESCA